MNFLKNILDLLCLKNKTIKNQFLLTLFFVVISIGFNVSIPLVFRKILDLMGLNLQENSNILILLLIIYGLLWITTRILSEVRNFLMFQPMGEAVRLSSLKIFNKIHSLDLAFYGNKQSGSILNIINRAQTAVPDVVVGFFFYIFPTVIEILVATFILGYLYGWFYGLGLLIILIAFTSFSIFGANWSSLAQTALNKTNENVSGYVADSLLNFENLKYFSNLSNENNRLNSLLLDQQAATLKFLRRHSWIALTQSIIIGIGLLFLILTSGRAVITGAFSVGDFVLINNYVLQFVAPLSSFGIILRNLRKGMTDLESVSNLLSEKPKIKNSPQALILKKITDDIIFKNVNFGYQPDRLILKDFSLRIKPGETVAIVGPTGSGKSTIAKLLFRMYEADSGKIMIGDKNVKEFTIESLRSNLAIVPQDTILLNDTIYNNIVHSMPFTSSAEVLDAIRQSHLEEFLNKLPMGYKTVVGERGFKVSGGEKQRIAIARAIIKRPSVFIFDEATSALDSHTEKQIQKNLEEISTNTTSITIAHRLSTIVNADRIIVLNHGVISEEGQHEELLNKNGIYAHLWNTQRQKSSDNV